MVSAAVAAIAETTALVRVRCRAKLRVATRHDPRARAATGSSTLTKNGAIAHAPSSTETPPTMALRIQI